MKTMYTVLQHNTDSGFVFSSGRLVKLCELVIEVRSIGTRHGEKLYEALLGREELACAQDMGDYFRIPPDARDLNYAEFVEVGDQRNTACSHGEAQLQLGRGHVLPQHGARVADSGE